MKRQDIIDVMRLIANRKMKIELRLIEMREKDRTVHLSPSGLQHYFSCSYCLGILRELLRDLDRKRNTRLRQEMKRRYNERR